MKDYLEEYRKSNERLRRALESPFKKFFEQRRMIADQWSRVSKEITQQRKLLAEGIKQAADDVEKFKLIMLEFEFPPHYDMAIVHMRQVVSFYNEHGKEKTEVALTELLIKEFNNDQINRYLEKWLQCEWLSARHSILKEAIESHNNGLYFSAICTLLPQIEGVIVQSSQHEGWMTQRDLIRIVEGILDKDKTFNLDNAIKMIYIKIVLDNFHHGQEIKSPLSRHAILHGADTKFGYQLNSIRCILLLDYLVYKLNGEN